MEKEFLRIIRSRRSIRRYTGREVPLKLIRAVVRAATYAPSSHDSQPWEFIIVRKKTVKEALSRTHRYSGFLKNAPVVIVALSNQKLSPSHFVEDCSAAIENLLLAAHSLGLGACWVAVYSAASTEREDYVRERLAIPNHLRIIGMIGLGYPDERPGPKRLRSMREVMRIED